MKKDLAIIFLLTIPFLYIIEQLINYKELRRNHDVYHHDMQVDIKRESLWGTTKYIACTDKNAFKISCKDFNKNNHNKKFDIAFIGDSFTEGLDYDKSFVGLIADHLSDHRIANLGVSSYSPSIYYYKIKYLLSNGYKFKHMVVYADISDIQDEAIYIESNNRIDNNHVLNNRTFKLVEKNLYREIKDFFKIHFPFTYIHLRKAKQALIENEQPYNVFDKNNIIFKKDFHRGSWTYNQELLFRNKLSVKDMMNKNLYYMERIYNLLKANNIELSVAVYPWPSQILWDKADNNHVSLWRDFCDGKCYVFLDNYENFFKEIDRTDRWSVIMRYYILNDVHYNDEGNRLIADNFIENFDYNLNSSK